MWSCELWCATSPRRVRIYTVIRQLFRAFDVHRNGDETIGFVGLIGDAISSVRSASRIT